MTNTLAQYTASALTAPSAKLLRIPPKLTVSDYARRFSALALPGADGASLTSWTDLAGSGTLLTPLTAAPTLATQNGLRVVRFDGNAQAMSQALTRNQPHSVVILGRYRSTVIPASGISALTAGSNTTGAARADIYLDSTGNYRAGAGGTAINSGIVGDTNFHVFIATYQGSGSVLRIDATEATGSNGTQNATQFVLGGVSGSSWFAPVDIAEAMVFTRSLSSGERATMQSELAALLT